MEEAKQLKQVEKKHKILNINSIRICTVVVFILSILLYEIFYCNARFVVNNCLNLEKIQYNISVCRIAFYFLVIVIYFVFSRKLTQPAIEAMDNKMKRVTIYIYIPIMIICTLFFYIKAFNNLSVHSLYKVTLGVFNLLAGLIFLIYVSKDHVKNFIIACFTFGLIFSISTEYYHAFDEKKHFASAFNLAYLNVNFQDDPIINEQLNNIPHRTNGNEFYQYYEMKYDNKIEPNTALEDISSTPATYSRVIYIFPAIGIFLAKTIGGTVADVFIAGRIFNLIFYIILMSISIKIIPFKKSVLIALGLLPMVVLQAASYSIDTSCVAVVVLFMAYVFKLYKMDEIKLKNWGVLGILFLLMLTAKSMAYIAVGALIFILPLIKIIKKQNKMIKIGLLILVLLIILATIGVLFYFKNNVDNISSDTRGGAEVNAPEQIKYIINNPLKIVKLELNYTNSSLLNFGWLTALHQNAFFTEKYGPSTFLVIILFLSYISILDDSYNFNKKEKTVFVIIFFMVYIMTNIVLYVSFTPVGSETINGYQARYLFPILPLLLVCISNKNIKVTKGKNTNLLIILSSIIILMISVLEAIMAGRP